MQRRLGGKWVVPLHLMGRESSGISPGLPIPHSSSDSSHECFAPDRGGAGMNHEITKVRNHENSKDERPAPRRLFVLSFFRVFVILGLNESRNHESAKPRKQQRRKAYSSPIVRVFVILGLNESRNHESAKPRKQQRRKTYSSLLILSYFRSFVFS